MTTNTNTTEQATTMTSAEELKATLEEFQRFMNAPATPEEEQRAALIRAWLEKE